MIKFTPKSTFTNETIILFIDEQQVKQKRFPHISNAALTKDIITLIKRKGVDGKAKNFFPIITSTGRKQLVLIAGVGDPNSNDFGTVRSLVRDACFSPYVRNAKSIEIIPHRNDEPTVNAYIEGVLIGTYSWNKYKKDTSSRVNILNKSISFVCKKKPSFAKTIHICESVNYSRDLINDNADTVTAQYFEAEVKKVIRKQKSITVEILNETALKAKGLNLHLAVNQGSKKAPRLVIVRYQGAAKNKPWTAVVGKGLTFDTGGLNLKPTGYIETMRCDMSGAAAVLGALKNIIKLNVKKNILFAFGLAENAIGGSAYKPGDVIKSYSGKTVEIGNTDAEGRLVLADAIAYIVKNYKPDAIIDIATLTGACVVALGNDFSGFISNNSKMTSLMLAAAERTDDRIWQLPTYPELTEAVKSEIADIKNIGFPKGAAGTLTAGEFLRQFTGDTPWGHLDIAGTAFVNGPGRRYFGYGATGAGVRLLTEYLRNC